MRKFIEETWVFEKELIIQDKLEYTIAMLVCEGLDTIAKVTLNGIQIGSTDNQFRRYLFDVSSVLKPGVNTLRIEFEDAVKFAMAKAKAYPYYVGGLSCSLTTIIVSYKALMFYLPGTLHD
jgi:beta-mannosidase